MSALIGLLLGYWLALGTEAERQAARLIVVGLLAILIVLVALTWKGA